MIVHAPSTGRTLNSTTCVDAEPFALQVTDNSMEPEFRRGCVVVVDPSGVAKDGAYVVAEVDGEIVFRKLRLRKRRAWLEALNESYPSSELVDGVSRVKGVVVQRAGSRRRYHKRYD